MSKSDKRASGKERDGPASDSVYDFLYHDSRRIGSFLAQFDDAGHLQQVTQTESVAKGARRGWNASIGGGLADIASGQVGLERSPSEGGSEASARVYDPLWTNALVLLDYLTERDMIERDLSRARIGQFVLAGGELTVLDLTMIRKMWELPSIRAQVSTASKQAEQGVGNRRERRREHKLGSQRPRPAYADVVAEVIGIMPHAVHARIAGSHRQTWCTLKQEGLVVSSDDLFLKHGASVPGPWSMLGILDALPDSNEKDAEAATQRLKSDRDMGVAVLLGGFGAVVESLGPIVRMLLGRPAQDYGITPLLIFREVTGR